MISPPVDLPADRTAATAYLVVAAVFLAVACIWAAARYRRDGALPLVLIAGGLIAALQESLIDRMILLWYPANTPAIAFTAMGTPQPLYMILIYGGFVGGGTFAAYRSLQTDRSGRGLWTIFVGIVVLDALFEIPATAGNIFYYYGEQPFQVVHDGWAVYYGFLAAAAPVLAGWILHHLVPRVRGAAVALLALVPPTAWATVYFGAGWPTFITVNSGSPTALRWGSAVATMALATGFVVVMVRSMRATAPISRQEPAPAPPVVRATAAA